MGSSPDVVIRDVGPRDGLQSLERVPSLETKTRLVRGLLAAGVQRIEAGSFVSPRAVPAMADSHGVFTSLPTRAGSLEALVMSTSGAQRALDAGADALVCVVAASETFSQRNAHSSVADAVDVVRSVVSLAAETRVVADIATSFGCAYEGHVPTNAVVGVAEALLGLGIREITLADTTGMATPPAVIELVKAVRSSVPPDVVLGLHFHNTRGLGLVNAQAGLEAGVRLFDASIAGLGGCPFSPGATGNVCTEDLVHLFHALGLATGIDLEMLLVAARQVEQDLELSLPGQLLRSGPVPAAVLAGAAR